MTTLLHPQRQIHPSSGKVVKTNWKFPTQPQHEFLAIACPDDEGGFSVFAANIPGVVSQGETEAEAEQNIVEAFQAMLEACKKRGQSLPYSHRPTCQITPKCRRIWVVVDG